MITRRIAGAVAIASALLATSSTAATAPSGPEAMRSLQLLVGNTRLETRRGTAGSGGPRHPALLRRHRCIVEHVSVPLEERDDFYLVRLSGG